MAKKKKSNVISLEEYKLKMIDRILDYIKAQDEAIINEIAERAIYVSDLLAELGAECVIIDVNGDVKIMFRTDEETNTGENEDGDGI